MRTPSYVTRAVFAFGVGAVIILSTCQSSDFLGKQTLLDKLKKHTVCYLIVFTNRSYNWSVFREALGNLHWFDRKKARSDVQLQLRMRLIDFTLFYVVYFFDEL